MDTRKFQPDSHTYASLLQVCRSTNFLPQAKLVHAHIILTGFKLNRFLDTKILIAYAKCGSLVDARRVLEELQQPNVVSWTTMIAAYSKYEHDDEALGLFYRMQRSGIRPDEFTVASVLPACASMAVLEHGYAENGNHEEALSLFCEMQQVGVGPDEFTFASVLPSCTNLVALEHGRQVHEDIIRKGLQSDVYVRSALVDMYAKSGSIEDARKFFDKLHLQDVVAWTAMIVGYALHGYEKEALCMFEQMQDLGMKPDHVTFVGVLFACCHAGLVDDGWHYFHCMSRDYQIMPRVEHYCCMVDLLGRSGKLYEALDFINRMPIKPEAAVWGTFLSACRIHTNIKLGEYAAERVIECDPETASHYVVLSNIYREAGRWNDAEKVRKVMKDRGIKKMPGCSWIQVNKTAHAFVVGDG